MNDPTPRPVSALDEPSLARLRELDPDGKNGVVRRVLSTFESSLLRQVSQLAQARDAGDTAALGLLAHTLKSSSAAVGALSLSARCADLELAARAGDSAGLPARVEQLLSEAEGVLQAVRAMLRP